jgi:hypothetical protein
VPSSQAKKRRKRTVCLMLGKDQIVFTKTILPIIIDFIIAESSQQIFEDLFKFYVNCIFEEILYELFNEFGIVYNRKERSELFNFIRTEAKLYLKSLVF